jgi:hypothetical protein
VEKVVKDADESLAFFDFSAERVGAASFTLRATTGSAAREPAPLVTLVWSRTVAKVDSVTGSDSWS